MSREAILENCRKLYQQHLAIHEQIVEMDRKRTDLVNTSTSLVRQFNSWRSLLRELHSEDVPSDFFISQ